MTRKFSYIYKGEKEGFNFEGIGDPNLAENQKESKKFHAFTLRSQGSSYGQISKELGISKSTLSYWFSSPEDTETKEKNKQVNLESSKMRLFEFSKRRKQLLFDDYEKALEEARNEYEKYKNDPLFVAGLMIYAGEGDRASRHNIRISNRDYRIHAKFIEFMEKYLYFPREKRVFGLISYPDLDQNFVEEYWSEKLEIPREKFFKTMIIRGKSKRKLQFGVGMTIITNTRLKYKLLEWVDSFLNNK